MVSISIRSVNIVNRTGYIAENAITKHEEIIVSEVRDLAKAFAVEWATWNGNHENYRHRLGAFFNKIPNISQPSDTVQQVTSSSVVSVNEYDKGKYRVKVLLHTRRLTPVDSSMMVNEALYPITEKDLQKIRTGSTAVLEKKQAWLDNMICVETVVKLENGEPTIAGLPVIIDSGQPKGKLLKNDCSKPAPKELVTFVEQFLSLYFTGQSLNNFIVPGCNVKPVQGNWKLEAINMVSTNDDTKPTKAYVVAVVSAPGISRLNQHIYLKLEPKDGNYLVVDISAGL